jgi:chromosome segregation ATPase
LRQVEDLSLRAQEESDKAELSSRARDDLQGTLGMLQNELHETQQHVEKLTLDSRAAQDQVETARAAASEASQSLASESEAQVRAVASMERAVADEKTRGAAAIAAQQATAAAQQATAAAQQATAAAAIKQLEDAAAVTKLQMGQTSQRSQAMKDSLTAMRHMVNEASASATALEAKVKHEVDGKVRAALAQHECDQEQLRTDVANRAAKAQAEVTEAQAQLALEKEVRLRLADGAKATSTALAASVEQLATVTCSLQRVRSERDEIARQLRKLQETVAASEPDYTSGLAAPFPSEPNVVPLAVFGGLQRNPLMMDEDELYQVCHTTIVC